MLALIGALIGCALAQAGRRGQMVALLLHLRFSARAPLVAGLVLAVLANVALSVVGGRLIGPVMPGNARMLLLAIALLGAGVSLLVRVKAPAADSVNNRYGAFPCAFATLWAAGFGDSAQLLVMALATMPYAGMTAAIGGFIGTVLGLVGPLLIGPAFFQRVPLRLIARCAAGLFLLSGAWLAVAALGLTGQS